MLLSPTAQKAWLNFINNSYNLGHVQRKLNNNCIQSHVDDCLKSASETANRIKNDLPNFIPQTIVEIGSSTGLNCLVLQKAYPYAKTIGIEPEPQATSVAHSMINTLKPSLYFIQGVGEQLPLSNNSIDLIVCHTVIEHVKNVEEVIAECARVLKPGGILHLDAPNYLWPFEPHLEIWTIPILGKRFVRYCAYIQRKYHLIPFLEHLKFVTPFQIEKYLKKYQLSWENRVSNKILDIIDGNADIKKYKLLSLMVSILGTTKVSRLIVLKIIKCGIYPSLMYTIKKPLI